MKNYVTTVSRHNVADAMNNAKVYPPHAVPGMTGHYGRGPGLMLLAEAVESISYEGLKLPTAKCDRDKSVDRRTEAARSLDRAAPASVL